MSPAEGMKPRALQLKPSMEALGVVLSFICKSSPYADFRAAKIIAAIQHQLTTGCHVCLMAEERLVAYAGWLPIDANDGERWMQGEINLRPVPSSSTGSAALTIVSVSSPHHIAALFRACRKIAPQSVVYFKRDYAGGRTKKSKVLVRGPRGGLAAAAAAGPRR